MGFFMGFSAVVLFGPLAKHFKSLGISPVMVGLLISIPNLSGSLLRIPFASMVDTRGGKKPLAALLILSCLGMIGTAVIMNMGDEVVKNSTSLLLLFGILAGCGIATFSVGIAQTSYWFSQKEQGVALGTYAGIGNLAPGIFSLLLTSYFLKSYGLPKSYAVWTVLLIGGTVVYLFLAKDAWFFQLLKKGAGKEEALKRAKEEGQTLFPKGNSVESLVNSAKVGKTWGLVLIYFTTFGGFLALAGWFTNYWQSLYGLDLKTAGFLTSTYAIGASLLRIYGGKLSDKWGGYRVNMVFLTITLIGSVIMSFSSNLTLSVAGMLFMTAGMGVTNAGVFKLVPQYVPDFIGGAAGWIGGLGALGGFVIPNVMTQILIKSPDKSSGFEHGFFTFILLSAVSLVTMFLLNKKTDR